MDEPTTQPGARALALVMQAGELLLENGAEVFRVQDTMTIMANSYGLKGFHAYVLTNGLFASADGLGLSAVRNVPRRGVHLGRIEAVNELSREAAAGSLTLAQAEQRMAQARHIPVAGTRAQLVASGFGSLCFAFLFGATVPEAFVALGAGVALGAYLLGCEKWNILGLLRRLTGAALVTVVCLAACVLFTGTSPSAAIIGTLMILTPGVAMTMGIQDLLRTDYLSGTIRMIDAVLIAGSIACGTGLVLGLYTWLTGVAV